MIRDIAGPNNNIASVWDWAKNLLTSDFSSQRFFEFGRGIIKIADFLCSISGGPLILNGIIRIGGNLILDIISFAQGEIKFFDLVKNVFSNMWEFIPIKKIISKTKYLKTIMKGIEDAIRKGKEKIHNITKAVKDTLFDLVDKTGMFLSEKLHIKGAIKSFVKYIEKPLKVINAIIAYGKYFYGQIFHETDAGLIKNLFKPDSSYNVLDYINDSIEGDLKNFGATKNLLMEGINSQLKNTKIGKKITNFYVQTLGRFEELIDYSSKIEGTLNKLNEDKEKINEYEKYMIDSKDFRLKQKKYISENINNISDMNDIEYVKDFLENTTNEELIDIFKSNNSDDIKQKEFLKCIESNKNLEYNSNYSVENINNKYHYEKIKDDINDLTEKINSKKNEIQKACDEKQKIANLLILDIPGDSTNYLNSLIYNLPIQKINDLNKEIKNFKSKNHSITKDLEKATESYNNMKSQNLHLEEFSKKFRRTDMF